MSLTMALSPLDGRYYDKMHSLRPIFSEFGFIRFRVFIEIRWLQFLAKNGNLPELPSLSEKAKTFLNNLLDNFSEKDALRIKEIERDTNHDVKAIEYFIKEKMQQEKELSKSQEFIHFGCTSEDINNLAYALMLKKARDEVILPSLHEVISPIKKMAHEHADIPLLTRTHGQPATPSTIGKEMANVLARLTRQMKQLKEASFLGKLNGATGNYNALAVVYPKIDWPLITEKFISELELQQNPFTTQIEPHDYLAEFFAILMRINTILIDLNRDMWGYISLNYFAQKNVNREVGSSTMPHKINPIDFENAEGNLGLSNALLDHMALKLPISRWQRDLTDSTVLRNMGVALGYALLAYQSTVRGLNKITLDVEKIKSDLNDHWEVLAEPIQMMMRRHGIDEPYEKLKNFTRGQKITKKLIHQFIEELKLPNEIKQELLLLTPENYIGYAHQLAKDI